MKGAVLRAFGTPLHLESRPDPQPRGDEVLVQVRACGVCRTDLHLQDGMYPDLALPRILGHEIAGEALGLGPVLVYGNWGDGTCAYCRRGEEQLCAAVAETGWVRDGGYADRVLVPSRRYLLPLDGIDPVQAAPLADAGVTPYRAVRRALPWLEPGAWAVVLGVGGLGQFAVQYLKLLSAARVRAIDPDARKRARAQELGADEAVGPADEPAPARVVLDFVGTAESLRLAARTVEPAGLVVQVGEGGGRMPFGLGGVPHEASFTTSISGSIDDLRAVLGHARRGEIRWQVDTMPLEQVNEALGALRAGQVAGRLVLIP